MPIGEIVIHPKYGKIELIEDLGRDIKSRKICRVRFISTGYELVTRYDLFKAAKIRDEYYGIDFNKLYDTNLYGKVKILEYVGRGRDHRVIVKCLFLNSNTIANLELRQLLKGSVTDPHYGINFNKIYQSNTSGPFVFKEIYNDKTGHIKAKIQFVLTNYEKIVQIQNAFNGEVKDDSQTKIIPIDKSLIDDYDLFIHKRLYAVWRAMIDRCTNSNSYMYRNYGAIGVRVCDEWLDFDRFEYDATSLPQYDKYFNQPFLYQIDKDYIQRSVPKNNRVYSKSTCMFLFYLDNLNMRTIDYLNENKNIISSKYFGVVKVKDAYRSSLMIDGNVIKIGTFYNEVMAAAAFNYYEQLYHPYELIPLINNVPNVPPEVFERYKINQ